ncbi:MAG: Fe-S cluster assembly protein SufD [Cyanosarcina radialis HA8281-LM2]|jgi:Fe-S cluster assembly protein SufD|nr:Fe-S cluster assembly protein SufD [Cyanosarcina radialis HA8281-LM2]
MTTQVSPKREVGYLSELLQQRPSLDVQAIGAETVAWLQEIRDRSTPIVRELAIPTTRDEEWRFTDLSSLLKVNFAAAKPTSPLPDISSLVLPEAAASRLVFVNGFYAPELSSVAGIPEGVFAGNLWANEIPRWRDYLAKLPGGQEVFSALNTASLTDAAVVWIPKNRSLEVPIHLLFVSTAGELPTVSQPRCLVVAESGSAVTVIEEYAVCPHPQPLSHRRGGQEYAAYLTNAVTEIWVGENAQVTHARMQREGEEAFHVGKTAIAQARHSRYTCCAVSLGAKVSRHNLEIFQTGEGTETILNALTKIAGEQLADTHSTIALNHPYGTARQVHKCIVGDRAHAVFNGKILVPKPAQLTDAGQLSRTLLLSPKARVDTKPQLEITADNVKCAHGATVSQLETDEIFYLQSRGLDADSARNLLINAFATEIVDRIPIASLRQTISQIVRSNPIS